MPVLTFSPVSLTAFTQPVLVIADGTVQQVTDLGGLPRPRAAG
jgi:hypothetical protein